MHNGLGPGCVSVCICVPFAGNLTQPSSETTIVLLQLRASTLVGMAASVAMSSSAPTATARPATPEGFALVRTLCLLSPQTVEFIFIITILNYERCDRRTFECACPIRWHKLHVNIRKNGYFQQNRKQLKTFCSPLGFYSLTLDF